MNPEFWNGLSLIKRLYDQSLQWVFGEYSLTRMELDILLFLANNPQFDTATDIINRRGLTKSHVSSSIQHLVELGYLQRCYLQDNRKVVHLRVLEAADEIVAAGRRAQEEFFSKLFAGFSSGQQRQLEEITEKISQNVRMALQEGGPRNV